MTSQIAFDHKTGQLVPCGDARIYVEEKGDPEQPALLMLHGGFGNIEDFNRIVPVLSTHFRLVGIDSRGHGRSTIGNSGLSYELLADDLACVISSLGLREYHILGFSDGGIVAYRYALRQESGLRKIVTIGSTWEMGETDPAWPMISGMTAATWKEMFPASYESYMHLNPAPDFDRLAVALVGMWTDLGQTGRPGVSVADTKNSMLVVRGDDDPLTTLQSMSRLRSMTEHVSVLNIPFAGHVAFDDAPEVFLCSLARFFDLPPSSSPAPLHLCPAGSQSPRTP